MSLRSRSKLWLLIRSLKAASGTLTSKYSRNYNQENNVTIGNVILKQILGNVNLYLKNRVIF